MSAYLTIRDPRPGPFFLTHENIPLSKGMFASEMRKALSICGIEQGAYLGHTFRIGAATAAAQAELSDSLIQILGRWNSGAFFFFMDTTGAVGFSDSYDTATMISARLKRRYQNISVKICIRF